MFDFSRTNVDNYNVESAANPIASVISTIYGGETYNFKEQLTYDPFTNLHLSGNAGYFFRQTKRSEDTPERYRDYNAGLKASWKINDDDEVIGAILLISTTSPTSRASEARHPLLLRCSECFPTALQPQFQ